ncbi:MAG: SDR family oxidoreductase [Gammaproteobacteria bacterium]|nr:SDR family oxidoreductase [Gammaproteobacteria bacterium]
MNRLEHKTAVVTGASSGIGAAIARRFGAEGAEVIVNYRSSIGRAQAQVDSIVADGGRAHAIQADVSDNTQIERLVTAAEEALGHIDIWVNNAGADILTGEAAQLEDSARLERLLAVDLRGTMECCWAVTPLMKAAGHGVILNMSWSQALTGMAGRNPELFAAVKAGVIGYSRCLARNVAPEVRVNVLAPGWIETGFIGEHMAADYRDSVLAGIPLNRMGSPEDVAAAAVFLAADDSGYITGHILNVHGGEG